MNATTLAAIVLLAALGASMNATASGHICLDTNTLGSCTVGTETQCPAGSSQAAFGVIVRQTSMACVRIDG